MTKVLITVGVDIEGEISDKKMEQITDTVAASLTAVAVPGQDVKVADHSADYLQGWHLHDPIGNNEACKGCRKVATKDVYQ